MNMTGVFIIQIVYSTIDIHEYLYITIQNVIKNFNNRFMFTVWDGMLQSFCVDRN